jgi:hypothetical protein
MRKIFTKLSILVVTLLVLLTLSACGEELVCDQGYIIEGEECVLEVIPDTEAPVLANVLDVEYTIDDEAPNYAQGVTASDNEDGDLTADIIVDDSLVDLTVAGEYTVTLTVSDAAGNETSETLTVTVSDRPLTNQELAELDIAAVSLGDPTTGQLTLPTFTANGTFFSWNSSNTLVITNQGFIIPPGVGSDPVTVTMNARAVNGPYVAEASYDITVQPWGEVSVSSSELVPFTGTSEEYVVTDLLEVPIYFVDNGNVPYIDIETFLNMVDGAIDPSMLTFTPIGDDQLEISYDVEWEDFDGSIINETYSALIDFTENTFSVDTFDFFENYVAPTESDFGDGLNYVDAEYVDSVAVTIPLGEYNQDILIYDDNGELQYLMPFGVTNLLFLGGIYYDAYYNGEEIWGVDTFSVSGIDQDDPMWQDVRTSDKNGTDIPEDLRWATYHQLALTFDYFYGLKEDKGIDTFYTRLSSNIKSLMTSPSSSFYNTLFDFAYGLDDLHTSYIFNGVYTGPDTWPGLSINDLGPRSRSFYEDGIWAMQDKIEAKYGSMDDRPEYELLDNDTIAVIHIDGFTIDTPDEVKTLLDALPTSVENVVLDLSYNTGGNIGAVFRIFGYMTEEQFTYHSQNPADDSAVTVFIESDYVAYDYNWYIISSKVSFSAANLMISMAQENGIATIMGSKSSGGASSIGAFYTPDGATMLISTNSVLSRRTGNEVDGWVYESIEYGVDPDYIMTNETSDAEIIAIITQDQAE